MNSRPIQVSSKNTTLATAVDFAYGRSEISDFRPMGLQSSLDVAALSDITRQLERRVTGLRNPRSPGSLVARKAAQPLDELLFDATANVKILTAQVAMHLDREWRERLFRQIDSLHDPAEWERGDEPIQQASFATFLKALVQIKPKRRPGFGLSHGGNLVAAWATGRDRLTIEFLVNDRVRWVITRYRDGEPEHFAGQTSVSRLIEGLAPYSSDAWFFP